jgi:molecular chaperone GrpE (heat shock protein)
MKTIETYFSELISFVNPGRVTTIFSKEQLISISIIIPGLLILISLIIIFILLSLKKTKPSGNDKKNLNGSADKNKSEPSFFTLRNNLESIKNRVSEAGTDLENFKLDLEDYGASSFKKEENLNEKYHRVLENLFLLIDHFEIYKKHRKKSDKINWFYEKARWVLEQEGIEEIPVTRGDIFNDFYHMQVESRPHKFPDGTILEIVSKGYYKKSSSNENDIIFRPAKVVVSNGPVKKNLNLNTTGEVKDE